MTAPDKPLHERLMACVEPHDEGLIDAPADLLREAAAELSRMRTALEEIRETGTPSASHFKTSAYIEGARDAYHRCAAIAERALTAGRTE